MNPSRMTELGTLRQGMLLPETSNSSSLHRNLPVDNCRHWVSLIGKRQELCFLSAQKHYFENILKSHLLCLGFVTGDPCPIPAFVTRLAGRATPGTILRRPSAAWDCYSSFTASRWVEGKWICRSVFPQLGKDVTCR